MVPFAYVAWSYASVTSLQSSYAVFYNSSSPSLHQEKVNVSVGCGDTGAQSDTQRGNG
jgi:hypothetical protein